MPAKSKYTPELVERICELIRSDSYIIAEICAKVGISESLFYEWKNSKVEFLEAIKKAKEDFRDLCCVEAQRSLIKRIRGYDVEEERIVYSGTEKNEDGKRKLKVKERVVTKKHVASSDALIIFTLTNRDPDNWRNQQYTEMTGRGGKDFIPEGGLMQGVTKEELVELLGK